MSSNAALAAEVQAYEVYIKSTPNGRETAALKRSVITDMCF